MANPALSETSPSAKQLVFMAMMATVVAVIVFLCGVLVGRGLPANRIMGTVVPNGDTAVAGVVDIGVPEIEPNPDSEPGSPLDALSYFDRLSSTGSALEELAVVPAEVPEVDAVSDSDQLPSGTELSIEADEPVAARSFVVQVTALRSGDEARTMATELVVKGYPAFVVDPVDGTATVYRVRVGPYGSHGEAETARHKLEMEERLKPWVIQP